MDNQQSNRTLDGDKLLTWMYENGYFSLKAADMIADEMEKGTFDKTIDAFATNDQMIIEAARSVGMLNVMDQDGLFTGELFASSANFLTLTPQPTIFTAHGKEYMRIEPTGEFYVDGKLVEEATQGKEIYEAMLRMFSL